MINGRPQPTRTDTAATVFVVDDDASFLTALSRLLRAAGYTVHAFSSAVEFLRHPPSDSPGCVILDLKMPGPGGLELQTALAEADNPLPVIFLTGHGDIPTSVRAMRRGAVDFLTKPVKKEALFEALQRALAQEASARQHRERTRVLRARYDTLTPRQREVLMHVVAGQPNKRIACDLNACERTIKAHRAAIMERLNVTSLAELVRFAQEVGVPSATGG
jgi:FixJ family two-component response regulator